MKTLLITGAAQGIGLATARRYVALEIQLATQGSGGPRVMGLSTKLWFWLDKLLPGFLRDPLCNYLGGARQAATH